MNTRLPTGQIVLLGRTSARVTCRVHGLTLDGLARLRRVIPLSRVRSSSSGGTILARGFACAALVYSCSVVIKSPVGDDGYAESGGRSWHCLTLTTSIHIITPSKMGLTAAIINHCLQTFCSDKRRAENVPSNIAKQWWASQ